MSLDLPALRAHLDANGVATAGPLEATLIAGGRSNLTYSVTDGTSRWAVRRPPAHGQTASAHDVAREFRVTSGLAASDVPVAKPLVLCEDESVIGAPFTVVEWVAGTIVRDRDELTKLTDDQVERVCRNLVDVLVRLHAVDVERAGLSGFGKPAGFLTRQTALWRRQWDAVHTRELPDLERLHERLAERIPAESGACLVHGDYRIDNTILGADDPTVVLAVVDWELATLGDPLTDLALMGVYRHPSLDVILGQPAAWTSDRLPSADDFAQLYAVSSGREPANWEFYRGLAFLKLAVIAEGIAYRATQGADAGGTGRLAAEAVPDLVAEGLKALG
ncbi:MAG: phosphotransferase family protein [Sporichthyaceae bacterium]